jgi:hypothetical protein
MTDEQVEKIIKRNMNLQINLAGVKADFEEALQTQWIGLTYQEQEEIVADSYSIRDCIAKTSAKLREKNNIKGEA